jgi:hypothetical protein
MSFSRGVAPDGTQLWASFGVFWDGNNEIDAVEVWPRLKKDPEDRKAYFALWDSREDLTQRELPTSCLLFRKFEKDCLTPPSAPQCYGCQPLNFWAYAFQNAGKRLRLRQAL